MVKIVLHRIDHPLQKILRYLLTHTLILLFSAIFALAHDTFCILYLIVGSTHYTPNPVIYISLISPTYLINYCDHYVAMRDVNFMVGVNFALQKYSNTITSGGLHPPDFLLQRSTAEISSSFHKSLNLL